MSCSPTRILEQATTPNEQKRRTRHTALRIALTNKTCTHTPTFSALAGRHAATPHQQASRRMELPNLESTCALQSRLHQCCRLCHVLPTMCGFLSFVSPLLKRSPNRAGLFYNRDLTIQRACSSLPQHNATQGAQPSTTHGAGAHKRLGKHDDGTLRASTYSCSSVKGDPGVPTGLTRWHKLYSVDFFGAWWRGRGRGGREGRERGNFLSCAHIYTRTHTPVHTCC